jgi:hypothetical protein
MKKSILIFSTMLVLLTPVISYAQQERLPQLPQPPIDEEEELYPPTDYEIFVDSPDAVIVTSVFKIGRLTIRGIESGPEVTAHVAWVLDEDKKVYAAKIGEMFMDFEELKTLEEGIGKILKGISDSFEKLGATSMGYQTVGGLSINYYSFEASSGSMRQTLRLVIREFSTRGSSTAPLAELRTLISQAREKLIALGAKQQATPDPSPKNP